jgi:thymidylate synthase (FAD)
VSVTELAIPPQAKVVLPPHGFVHLQVATATDLDVVNAARVSFAKQSQWEVRDDPDAGEFRSVLAEADEAVLRWLMQKRHGTPFEHNFFKFHVRAPIFVFREWHRHRIGISINEESARYSPLAGDFYIPEGDAWRAQVGKPGAYRFEVIDDLERIAWAADKMESVYKHAYDTYVELMEAGFAKEIARAVLPVGIYSQMIWTCNARSLMAFLSLRNDKNAQWEIRQYAKAMEQIFYEVMPITCDEFIKNGRVAP